MLLDHPITFSENVQPACEPEERAYTGELTEISGWGALEYGKKGFDHPIPRATKLSFYGRHMAGSRRSDNSGIRFNRGLIYDCKKIGFQTYGLLSIQG